MSDNNRDGWIDGDLRILKWFYENGLGRYERVRLIRSALTTSKPRPVSRGKGKKRKPWEGRHTARP